MLVLFIFMNFMMQVTMADLVFYYWLCGPNSGWKEIIENQINKTFKL